MNKIKKIILILILGIVFKTSSVYAFSINASNTIYVGSTVAVTVDVTDLTGRFKIISSAANVLAGGDSPWLENEKKVFYFTAKSVGTSTITISTMDVADSSGNEYVDSRSIVINVINKKTNPTIDVNKTYSKNNYLKNLSIDGYTLTPSFNKNTLEYSVVLSAGTEKVKINTSLEDGKARVKGDGEISVNEGINVLKVIVTAQNGNERIYVITASVAEKDPINVTINDKKYTVVKRKELLTPLNGYIEGTVKINEFEIPTYYNEVTSTTLVGLKDNEGTITYFDYDSSTGKYSLYQELSFDLMNLYIQSIDSKQYKKTTIKINDIKVPAYKINGINDYYLLYATNTSTGNKGYYLYDIKENSVQRYNSELLEKLSYQKNKLLSVVIVLSCVCFLTMLFLLVEVNRDNKRKNEV